MSTGAVNAFTPAQPTQNLTAGTTSASVTFQPCDTIMVWNAGSNPAFVAFGETAATADPTSSLPIPPNTLMLIGTGMNIGAAAFVTGTGSALVYVTPGLGTQH